MIGSQNYIKVVQQKYSNLDLEKNDSFERVQEGNLDEVESVAEPPISPDTQNKEKKGRLTIVNNQIE